MSGEKRTKIGIINFLLRQEISCRSKKLWLFSMHCHKRVKTCDIKIHFAKVWRLVVKWFWFICGKNYSELPVVGIQFFPPKISNAQSLQIFQIAVFKPPQNSSCHLLLVAVDWHEAVLQVNLEWVRIPSTWTVTFLFWRQFSMTHRETFILTAIKLY